MARSGVKTLLVYLLRNVYECYELHSCNIRLCNEKFVVDMNRFYEGTYLPYEENTYMYREWIGYILHGFVGWYDMKNNSLEFSYYYRGQNKLKYSSNHLKIGNKVRLKKYNTLVAGQRSHKWRLKINIPIAGYLRLDFNVDQKKHINIWPDCPLIISFDPLECQFLPPYEAMNIYNTIWLALEKRWSDPNFHKTYRDNFDDY